MLLKSGQVQTKLESMVLANPKAKQGSSAAINRGTVEGSFTLFEKSDLKERELARRFGADWGRYRYNVGAWWPRCSPWRPALEQL